MARFCRYCGQPVSDGARFCRSCGAAIPARPDAPEHSAPARDTARPRTTSSRVGAPVREPKKKSRGGRIVAAVLVAALLFTGFGWPGWLRGRKSDGPDYRMDGRVMELTIPALSKAQGEVYQAGSNAAQAYYTARLWLERLTKAAENGVTGAELESLVDQTAEAWRIADKISQDTEQMARALEKTEGSAKAEAGSVLSGLDLSVRAHAAESIDPKLLEWAQEITDMYDKAPAGRQVRTLAEQLGTDAKHAFEIVKQSQAIMKGKYESDADIANYWYETCMKTKTACKVIVVTTAIISSGGAAGAVGLVDGALLTASGVDAIVEVGDTTVNIVAGEGSQVQAEYSKMKDKIAPVTGVAGAAGLFVGGWSTAVDKAGQLIYISDSVHDLVENGKIAGIQLPGTGPAPGETSEQTVKMVKLPPADGETTPEEVQETLEKIGVPPEAAEKIAEAVTEKPQDAPPSDEEKTQDTPPPGDEETEDAPPAAEEETSIGDVMDLDELTDEELDQLLEELIEPEELEQEFDELFESFTEDIPVEDLPQEGDDEGFDNPENWVQPENPGEIESEPEFVDEGEPAQPGDDEGFDNPENWAQPENPGEIESEPEFVDEGEPAQHGDDEGFDNPENWAQPENPAEDWGGENSDVYDLICGTYPCTVTQVTEWKNGDTDRKTGSATYGISRDGTSLFFDAGGTLLPMQFDPDTLTGTFEDADSSYTCTFTIEGNSVSMHTTTTVRVSDICNITMTLDGQKTN